MSLQTRVRRLEGIAGGRRCGWCGFDGDWSKVETKISLGSAPGPDNCPECGRVLVIRVPGHFSKCREDGSSGAARGHRVV
jgi:hypothetical protein